MERLRIGLLVGAGLLVVVIAAFLGYARYRVRRGLAELPGRLGATITRESNGYTYSQSDGKKTIFTLHAAKAVEHTDGKYTLHDVTMVMYGHAGDRADHISGNEFEYDTKAEVIRAVGTVHIDLQAPAAEGSNPQGQGGPDRMVHVTTSGLVYVKQQAKASTSEGIDFSFGGLTGHAVGAEYNSDSGHLVLQSAVKMSGLARDRPVALAASHGELDRQKNQADFHHARYTSAGDVAEAELAHLYMRKDGSVERIEGEGHVMLQDAGQGSVTCGHAEVALDMANKPRTAVLAGNVQFVDDEPLRQAHGDSESADLGFDDHGNIERAVLHRQVHTYERVQAAGGTTTERRLAADELGLLLANRTSAGVTSKSGGEGKPVLREAKATGSAHLSSVASGQGKRLGVTSNNVAADRLDAHFTAPHGTAELSTVHGEGHTVLEQRGPGDLHQTSAGEQLEVNFREMAGAGPGGQHPVEIATAVQQGNVVIDRTLPPKSSAGSGAPSETQHALAGRASYDADSDRLTLTEDVQISDAESTVSAARIVLEHDSGNASAEGSVKATYMQAGASEPVHVLAARAELNHDAGRATFYGSTEGNARNSSGLARMWQAGAGQHDAGIQDSAQRGGSQIEAPVLVFEQETRKLVARSEKPGQMGQVHTVLASAAGAGRPMADKKLPAKSGIQSGAKDSVQSEPQSPVRITSSEMIYSDEKRQAEFTGGVQVVDRDGEMRARQATVFLAAASGGSGETSKAGTNQDTRKASGSGGNGMLGGNIERIVATQGIEITQPGRRATGERLVYTANDQMFVLSGTASAPARVVDAAQGSTAGSALRFHTGDDSVSVLGDDGLGTPRKVHTETHLGSGVKQ